MIRASASRLARRCSLGACTTLVFGLALAATPREAEASGYLTARFGSDHGTPAQPNTYAIYYNPAALGATKGTTITGDVSLLVRWAHYQRTEAALNPDRLGDQSYIDANSGQANLLNLLALPFAGVNSDFGTSWFRGGFAVYVPFGGLATWDKRDGIPGSPGTRDGVSRWHNISGHILAVYPTFAGAFRLSDMFSVGLSVTPVIHSVATARARNIDGSDDVFAGGALKEGRSLLHATGVNMAASIGVFFQPNEDWKLGLSYLAPPGLGGDTRLSGTLETKLGTAPQSKDDIDFVQRYPHIVRLGADWRADKRLVIRSDFEYVTWSTFDKQCVVRPGAECDAASDGRVPTGSNNVILNVPRRWNDAVGFRIGPGYWVNDDLELFGSFGLTTPAVPKETIDASTIDALRLYFTAGAKYTVNKHWALAGSYNHIAFMPVDTRGANDQDISAHPANGPDGADYNASRSPSADGRYRSQIGMVNVNVAYSF